jgi:hypothetical protein
MSAIKFNSDAGEKQRIPAYPHVHVPRMKHRSWGLRSGIATAGILLSLILLSCGASQGDREVVPQPDGAVLNDINSAPAPVGIDAALFEDLRAELLRVVKEHAVQRAPDGSANEVSDLLLEGSDAAGWQLSWSYLSTGDYDFNSEVNIADLTPIGVHYRARYGGPGWAAADRADGDRNGEVNIADITPIGINYGTALAGYNIYGGAVAEGPWTLVGQLPLSPQQLTTRLQYALAQREYEWYCVRPYDRADAEGIAGTSLLTCEPALMNYSTTTASETKTLGSAGGSLSGPDAGFGPLQVIVPAGALEQNVELSVGSVEGNVAVSGQDLGAQLCFLSAASPVRLLEPITLRWFFEPADIVSVQPMQAWADGRMVPLNVSEVDYTAGRVDFELLSIYPADGVHSTSGTGTQSANTLLSILSLIGEYQHDSYSNERRRYSTGFEVGVDSFSLPAADYRQDAGTLGQLAFCAWYFNNYRQSQGSLAQRFTDPAVQRKIATRAAVSFVLGIGGDLSSGPQGDPERRLEQIKLAMRRSAGPVPVVMHSASNEYLGCFLAISYLDDKFMLFDPLFGHMPRLFDSYAEMRQLRLLGDGSLPMYENFENILLDATADPPFGGYEAATVNIDSHQAAERVTQTETTLRGHVDSTYYLVDEIIFWNTREPLQEMRGVELPETGEFNVPVKLFEGANEFVILTRGMTFHPLNGMPTRIEISNNLEDPGTFWLEQGEEQLPSGYLRFTIEWEGRFESNTVPQSYDQWPYLAMSNDLGTNWISRNNRGSLSESPWALWEDRTVYDSENEARSGQLVITVAQVSPGTYSISMDAPVLSMNVIRVTNISVAGPVGGAYPMVNGVAGANQRWHGLTYDTDGNTVTLQDEAFSLGGI